MAAPVHPLVCLCKFQVDLVARLSHHVEHTVRDVFRSYFKLPADVVLNELAEERIRPVRHQIIKTDPGADKYLLHARQCAQLPQQRNVIAVVDAQMFARGREQALPVLADAFRELLLAGRLPEIGRRPADIVDISFKIRLLRHQAGFLQDRFMAARLDDASLMEGQRAEIAAAEAATVADEAEAYLGDSRDASVLLIGRMRPPAIGQVIDIIHLLLCERLRGRILYHIDRSVRLDKSPAGKRICIAVLRVKASGIVFLVRAQFLIGRKQLIVIDILKALCPIAGSLDKGDIMDRQPGRERLSDPDDRALSHAVRNQVCPAIHQDRALQ